ncbi:MAG: GHKL domain-containing protein [Promethearchaeota archaeon]|nr:MAG: GHKL domain-containing protein [Candidatus Lokiarchaeota archaeon]
MTDLTEKEKQLKKQKEDIEELLNATKNILKYQNFETSAREIFDSCKRVTGAKSGYVALLSEDGSENELLFLDSGGLPCTVDPELPMPIRGLRAESYKSGKVVYDNSFMSSEYEKFLPKGHVILRNVLFGPLNIEGETVGIIGLANKDSDFTERDAKLVSGLSELAAISLYNSQMITRLKISEENYKKAYQRSELYKNIFAHDISNILQNVQSATELLDIYASEADDSKKRKELIMLAQEQVEKGSKLISDLLKFSEIEEKGLNLHKVNVCQKMRKAIEFVKRSYPESSININLKSKFEDLYILGNHLLGEVFENILINAVKYNESTTKKIDVNISKDKNNNENFIKIEFIDNGIGIPDSLKEKIFNKTIEKDEEHKGLGLGLLLVKRIVDEYKGTIQVKNRVKEDYRKGSNFIIKLPECESSLL